MEEPQRYVRIIRKLFTLSAALQDEENVLEKSKYPARRTKFYGSFLDQQAVVHDVVASHLNLDREQCKYSSPHDWNHGSFNFVVPLDVMIGGQPKRVVFRTPLPFKSGEHLYPGNLDEQLRCEVATYIFLQENCPEIPIPTLRGFGFTDGTRFTPLKQAPFLDRLWHRFQNFVRTILGYPRLAQFVRTKSVPLSLGYLLVDHVEGRMLSDNFGEHKDDEQRSQNLYRGLSKMLLSLCKVPQTRIGSFTIDNQGVVSLSNRPLDIQLHWLENQGIPTNIDRQKTYSDAETFALDFLGHHDSRLIHQPNSINDLEDGRSQMTVSAMMRLLCRQFAPSCDRFVLTLSDLHASNIFVDEDWNITSLIDLEWAYTLPIQLQQPPYWLTGQTLDHLVDDELTSFTQRRNEFMTIFQEEERSSGNGECPLTQSIEEGWNSGSFWYFGALCTTKGFYNIYMQHIQPLYASKSPDIANFWHRNVEEILQKKLVDREIYLEALRDVAQTSSELDM